MVSGHGVGGRSNEDPRRQDSRLGATAGDVGVERPANTVREQNTFQGSLDCISKG